MTGTKHQFSNLRAILFDFDGTLLDSFPTHRYAFKTTLARFNIEMNEAAFLETYSPDWTRVYTAAGLPEKDWDLANTYWLEAEASQQPALFPGIPETLAHLRTRYPLGLVTAGNKDRVFHDLKRTGTDGYFQVVVTGDDVQNKKPSPEGLMQALNSLNVAPEEAIYLGDTTTDFHTAQAAGMLFISILSEVSKPPVGDEFIEIGSVNDLPQLLSL